MPELWTNITSHFSYSRLLPDQENVACKQTSPKHNAYPTWTKEFIFAGIDAFDLSHGGIELLLYDHHKFFSNSLIGGIRLTQPQRIVRDPAHRFSTGGTLPITQPISRDCSPVHTPVHTPGPFSLSKKSFLDIGKHDYSYQHNYYGSRYWVADSHTFHSASYVWRLDLWTQFCHEPETETLSYCLYTNDELFYTDTTKYYQLPVQTNIHFLLLL